MKTKDLVKKVSALVTRHNKETGVLAEQIIVVKNNLMVELNDCNEALKSLGFKVEDNVVTLKAENVIKINKGVIKQIVKEVPGPVQYVTKEVKVDISEKDRNNYEATISKLTTTIIDLKAKLTKANEKTKAVTVVDNSKELEDLREQLKIEKKSKQTWQSKYTKLETELKALKSENRKLLEDAVVLQEKEDVDTLFDSDNLPETKEPDTTDITNDDSSVKFPESNNPFYNEVVHKTTNNEKLVKTDSEILSKLLSINPRKGSSAEYYSSTNHFIITSKYSENITVIPKYYGVEVTPEDIELYKKELVSKLGFEEFRTTIAPVTVTKELQNKPVGAFKGSFSRVHASDLDSFNDKDDVFAGYILEKKFTGETIVYLYTWNTKYPQAVCYDLNKTLENGKTAYAPKYIVEKTLQPKIERLKTFYEEEINIIDAEKAQKSNDRSKELDAQQEKMNDNNALFNSYFNPNNVENNVDNNVNNNVENNNAKNSSAASIPLAKLFS